GTASRAGSTPSPSTPRPTCGSGRSTALRRASRGRTSGGPTLFFFEQKTAYELGLGIPAEPLFRSTLFPILASLLVRLVVLLPFQLLRLSLATPSRWTPLALSVFLHCVVALLLTLL